LLRTMALFYFRCLHICNFLYDIGYTTDNLPVVMLKDNIFDGKTGKPHEIISDFIADQIGNGYDISESGQKVYIGEDLPNEYTQSKYTKWILKNRSDLLKVKNQSAQNIKEIIEIATDRRWDKNTKAKHNVDAKYGFYKYTSRVALPVKDSNGNIVSSNVYDVELVIRNDADGKKYLYDIQNINKSVKQLTSTWKPKSVMMAQHSNNIVPQKTIPVNTNSTQNSGNYAYSDGDVQNNAMAEALTKAGLTNNTQNDFTDYGQYKNGDGSKITRGMDDSQRAEILKNKKVNLVSFDQSKQEILDKYDFEKLKNASISQVKENLKLINKEFGTTPTTYSNDDIEIEFNYSNSSFKESSNHQNHNYDDFAKLLTVLPDVVKNAQCVEVSGDKYRYTYREDLTLINGYTLMGAFSDDGRIVPVKLTVKEYYDRNNKLHLAVTVENKIETEINTEARANKEPSLSATSVSNVSITDILKTVNPEEIDFLKYFPDELLTKEQLKGKEAGINKDIQKYIELYEDERSVELRRRGSLSSRDNKVQNDFTDYSKYRNDDNVAVIDKPIDSGNIVTENGSTENVGAEKSPAKFTEDDLLEAYDRKEALQKDYEKAKRKIRLTDEEKYQLDGLLSGKVRKENIPPEFNIEGIMELYKYKSAIESENSKIQQHNAIRKEKLKARAKSLLETSDTWKEKKSGFAYGRETMERNIRDMVKDKATADAIIDEYFTPVHHNEAERTRFKNKMRGLVKKLNISEKVARGDKVSENFAVQFLGELNGDISYLENKKRLTEKDKSRLEELKAQKKQFLEDNPSFQNKEKMKKVERAIRNARRIYDYLFDEMNRVRVRNGYSPVEYRHNYFPHFITEEADGILGQMAKAIGINMDVTELPTNIAGKTQNFKPGIRYFKNAQRRWGIKTDFEFLQGFDKYIEGVSDVIYHTDDIQRLRSLESALSEKYSEKGVEDEIKALEEDTTLDSKEKYQRIKDLVEKDLTKFGGFAMELREYTNLIANKKSRFDRNAETFWRRHAYNVFNAINRNVAVNMIAGNLSSAFTNFIPLAQAKAECGASSLIKAAKETVSSYAHDDHLVNMSDFLTNRFGSDKITKTKTEKFNDALMTPMSLVDNFTSQVIWRAKYHDSIKKGMSATDAIKTADSFAAGLLADRSKGAMPTIFSARNIIAKSFTMFQVEVNNQYSYLFKDLPNAKEKKRELAAAFMWYFFASYLFNDLYEKVMGRRPAFDPLGMANDFAGNTFGKKIPNTVDLLNSIMSGEKIDFDTNKKKAKGGGLIGLAEDVAENLPFVGSFIGGGRVPISSGIPFADDPKSAVDAFSLDTAKERRLQILSDELPKLAYSVLPYGGAGQAIKTIKGISTVNKGGKYTYNSKGEKKLQYPVHNDTAEESNRNYTLAALFGRNALPTAQDWVKNEFDTMSVKDTERYDMLKENGNKSKLSYNTVREISALPEAKYKEQYDYIEGSALPKKSKTDLKITYMSNTARENLEEAKKAGVSDDLFVDTHYMFEYQGKKQHSLLPEKEQKAFVKEKDKKSSSVLKRAYLVTNEDLTPEQRLAMDRILINDETKKTVEDYSDLGHFYYSELSDAQKKRLPYAQQVIDVDVRSYYYWWKKTSGLKGKKNEKISKLQEMGMDYRTALLWYEYVLK